MYQHKKVSNIEEREREREREEERERSRGERLTGQRAGGRRVLRVFSAQAVMTTPTCEVGIR